MSDPADASPSSADEIAGALMSASGSARAELWARSQGVSALELGWALKRACDAAWYADPPKTRQCAEVITELAARRPHAEVDALAAWIRGVALLSQGEMEPALEALSAAGESFEALGRAHERAQTQVSRLAALAMLGRYEEALHCGQQARAVFDAVGDALSAGKIELNLGTLATRRERHDDALRHYAAALERFDSVGATELQIAALKGQADNHSRRHEFERADALYRQARERAQRGGFAMPAATIDGELGLQEMRRGRYELALGHFEDARRSWAALDAPHYLALAEENFGDAYLELNLLPEALTLYDRSLATYEAAGLASDRAWALSQRGRALSLLGRYEAAMASLTQAESAFAAENNPVGAAMVQLWLAELALRRREWRRAADHAAAAQAPLAQAVHTSAFLHARTLQAEALYGAGDAADAERIAHDACDAADTAGLAPAQRRARLLLGLLARDRGDTAAAHRCFEAVVESIESQRGILPSEEFRAAFLGDNLRPYQELVRGCVETGGKPAAEEALHWIERARARSLADSLDDRHADVDNEQADAAQRDVARLRRQLDDCNRRLSRPTGDPGNDPARLLGEVQRIEAALLEADRRRAVSGADAHLGNAAAFDLSALHVALGDDGALVEYFAVDDALFAGAVAGGAVTVVPLPARLSEVRALIEKLRFQTDTLRHGAARLQHRLPELQRRALLILQRLHAALWAPLAAVVDVRRAVIVPHGVLHYLPFEALHDGARFEVERREICRAPSAAVLQRCLERPAKRFDSAVLLGHADARLPQVPKELQAVAASMAHAHVFQGDAARADTLHGGVDADVLHIACHAQFRHDSPRFSALHLADGALTVRDAAGLRLGCGLVTLSACETGISAVMPGDELIGLTHAFLAAGVASVLASLWTVHDDAAATLMTNFYAGLRRDGRPAQALRAAQLDMLHSHPHPYFWSAFVLHGRW